jgi:hypothetical protein
MSHYLKSGFVRRASNPKTTLILSINLFLTRGENPKARVHVRFVKEVFKMTYTKSQTLKEVERKERKLNAKRNVKRKQNVKRNVRKKLNDEEKRKRKQGKNDKKLNNKNRYYILLQYLLWNTLPTFLVLVMPVQVVEMS